MTSLSAIPRPTRDQLVLPLLVAALLAMSPLTGSARLLPSLLLGSLCGTALLVARMRSARPRPTQRGRTIALPPVSTAAVLIATAIVFAPTLRWMYFEYTESIWRNGHGLFVPLFMILLARSALRRDATTAEESSAWGFAFVLPALALLIADAGLGTRYLSALALVLVLPGLSLLFLGARRTRRIALPLALGIFMVPLPTWLESSIGLRGAAAALATLALQILRAPVAWHHTHVLLPDGLFIISDNCAGFAALHAAFAFATLLAATSRSRIRALLVLLLVYPAVLVANALRCVAMVELSLWFGAGRILNAPVHGLSGIAVFAFVLGLLWLCADREGMREAIA